MYLKRKRKRKIMKMVVVSSYDVVREGIISLVARHENIFVEYACHGINEAVPVITGNSADIVLVCIETKEELEKINEVKSTEKEIKFIVLDLIGDNKLFVNALRYGVYGYILGRSNEQEIIYALDQVSKGKKYYDSCYVDSLIKENSIQKERIELLTVREREILNEIARGLSNKKICEKLSITEHTVKKHVSHIFEKLNIRDRTEAMLYVNKNRLK